MRPSTIVLAGAMKVLSREVQTEDGVANRALEQASERFYVLQDVLERLEPFLKYSIPKSLREQVKELIAE